MWKINHQKPHVIEAKYEQLMDSESEILILHEIVSEKYISLNVSAVPILLVQIY